jgi:APA family basic amino acid/polyamine antiporter
VSAVALIVANMIGAGAFTTSGYALEDLHRPPLVLLAWLVGGVLALCGALSYGALARRIPVSGGEYIYLGRIVHPLAGFLAGWLSLLVGFTAPIAAAALGLQAYLGNSLGGAARPEWIGTLAVLAAALMHGSRLRAGVALQNLAVGLKLLVIAGFIAVGFAWLPTSVAPPPSASPAAPLSAFAVTLVWISFAYSGWNAAVYVAGEVREPERNLTSSLLVGTLTVMGIYLALNAVFVYAAPPAQLAGRADIASAAAEALGGPEARRAVSLLVALALFTSISSMVMAGPRVYAQMAEDGFLPRWFRQDEEVPRAAVALQAALAVGVVWMADLRALLGYIGFTLGLSAAATVAASIWLRAREGPARVPIPGYPWVPVLFVMATVGAAAFMVVRQPSEALMGLVTLVLGLPLYWLGARRRTA